MSDRPVNWLHSQSRVAKMEKTDPTVWADLLLQALFRLGATRRYLVAAV